MPAPLFGSCLGGIIQASITEEAWLPAQVSTKKGGFGILASSSSTAALCNSLWYAYNDTHDLDGAAADTQFRRNIHEDAAWRPDGSARTQSDMSNLRDAHTLGTLMQHATHGDQISRAGDWLVGGSNSPLFDWAADLTRTALPHRILFLDQDTQCPMCGQVLE